MEAAFSSQQVTQVGATARRTTVVLPSAARKQQKIAVGDHTGVVTCFTAKRGVHEMVFQSPPGEREVTALSLGGRRSDKSQIYAANGQIIHGFEKKGKDFFKFNTSLTEHVTNMFVEDLKIWTAGEYIFNMFDNCKDSHFFMAADRINHMTVVPVSGAAEPNTVLACQDRAVRVLQGGDVYYESNVDGPVSCLLHYQGVNVRASGDNPAAQQVVYGTENGLIGKLSMDADTIRKGWVIGGGGGNNARASRGTVISMTSADVDADGVPEIICGRDDGSFEVYGFSGANAEPQCMFARDYHESITAVGAGNIMSVDKQELLATTYSGKVHALALDPSSLVSASVRANTFSAPDDLSPKRAKPASFSSAAASASASAAGGNSDGGAIGGGDPSMQLRSLRAEVDTLREQLKMRKSAYKEVSGELIAAEASSKARSAMRLLPAEAAYLLTVEIQYPIEFVTLQSSVDLLLLDVDSNVAIMSRSPSDAKNGNEVLATYRCQDAATTRLDIKVRPIEGRIGDVRAYVVPRMAPKTCQCASFTLKPLALHEKVASGVNAGARAVTTLKISGDFSLADIHAWASSALPELPPRLSADEARFDFHSTFLDTKLTAEYKRGFATFASDNPSTISIVKEVLSREATNAKAQISISLDVQDECVSTLLLSMRPKLDHHFTLARKQALIEPLKEIAMAENGDVSFMDAQYRDILASADAIEKQHKEAPRHLDFLRGIVSDLLVDWYKLRGRTIGNKPQLLAQVMSQNQSYSFQALMDVFGLPMPK